MKSVVKYIKAVGVTFDNRQQVIEAMSEDDFIYLQAEPENVYDPNAIAIHTKKTTDETEYDDVLGYIPKDRTKEVHLMMKQPDFKVELDEVIGGFKTLFGKGSYGVVLRLEAGYDVNYA